MKMSAHLPHGLLLLLHTLLHANQAAWSVWAGAGTVREAGVAEGVGSPGLNGSVLVRGAVPVAAEVRGDPIEIDEALLLLVRQAAFDE